MARLRGHPFTVRGRWQEDMFHSSSCNVMWFSLPPPLSLPTLFCSPLRTPLAFTLLSLSSFLPSLSFDSHPPCPHFIVGVPVSITQPVNSRDRIGVIGVEACVPVCVCVRQRIHSRHNRRSLFHYLLMRCDLCLVESWANDHTLKPPPTTTTPSTSLWPSLFSYFLFCAVNRCQRSISQPDKWGLTRAQRAGCQHIVHGCINHSKQPPLTFQLSIMGVREEVMKFEPLICVHGLSKSLSSDAVEMTSI